MEYFLYVVFLAGGFFIGFFLYKKSASQKLSGAEQKSEKIINDAKLKEKELLLKAQDKALAVIEESKKEENLRRQEINALQSRLEQRENSFSQKLLDLQDKQQKLYDKVTDKKTFSETVILLGFYNKLKFLGLTRVLAAIFIRYRDRMEIRLDSSDISLLLFGFYKMSMFCTYRMIHIRKKSTPIF